MPNPTTLLPRTPIAYTGWKATTTVGTQVHAYVYTQEVDGRIRQTTWNTSWGGSNIVEELKGAKINTPLAALSWEDNIRLFYVDSDNVLKEYQCDHGVWRPGGLNIKVHATSQLAAIQYNGEFQVFFQDPHLLIQKAASSPKSDWKVTQEFTKAITGSAITTVASNQHFSLFYQLADCRLREHRGDGVHNWILGKLNHIAPACASLSSVGWNDLGQMRLYTIAQDGNLQELAWTGSDWGVRSLGSSTPGSATGVVQFDKGDDIRVLRQAGSNEITEARWANGNWSGFGVINVGVTQVA